MKAAVRARYCAPEQVEILELEKPVPSDDEVLVRVRAAGLNILDWYGVTGRPWVSRASTGLRAPKEDRLGVDYAGTVEAVGRNVEDLEPGDEVFGGRTGALAEYVVARADRAIVKRPDNVPVEEAAAVAVAATTALQGLRDKGGLEHGQKVLINGASGGVGSFAIQIAKALGAEVTAVCSTPSVDLARSLGADRVVDYTKEDFVKLGERYDLLLDIAGTRSWSAYQRVLAPQAPLVVAGGPRTNRLLGPLGQMVRLRARGMLSRRQVVNFLAQLTKEDMETLRGFLEAGTVRTVVDRRYALAEVGAALRYQGEGHPCGKVVIDIAGDQS
jgi:NADPH:quinone reductase-like Zn-dependent oxidoreductase